MLATVSKKGEKSQTNHVMSALRIEVHDIKGSCPIYKKGDEFLILDGYKLKADRLICMHSLSSLMPYYVALNKGISPRELGLSKDDSAGYIQCLDPCEYTSGGSVIFKLTITNKK